MELLRDFAARSASAWASPSSAAKHLVLGQSLCYEYGWIRRLGRKGLPNVRSRAEKIGFSPHLTAMYIENMRLISAFCKENYDLTSSEYELLLTLFQSQNDLLVRQLADFLMLQVSTIWQMIPPLEDRGLIVGSSDERDRRFLSLALSDKALGVIRACSQELYSFLSGITQESLPDHEYTYISGTISSNLDILRGHPSAITMIENEPSGLRVEFLVFMRAIIHQWRDCIRSTADLSLNEFRILHALVDSSAMRVQDIADFLILSRSQVSACKSTLKRRKLVQEAQNPADGRSILLNSTSSGNDVVGEVLPLLDAITVPVHHPGTDEGAMVLRAWHSRMYFNLRRYYVGISRVC